MKYLILASANHGRLMAAVQMALNEGWKPQGGVAVAALDGTLQWSQALVLEERPAPLAEYPVGTGVKPC